MQCRSCSSDNTASIMPLGMMPLANRLLKKGQLGEHEPKFNLEVMLCEECGLAQLRDLVAPKELFTDYVYFSSNSKTMLQSANKLVETVAGGLPKDSLIVEVASNDGYLLRNYVEKGFSVLGIDPAENIAKVANENGINTLCDFFGKNLAANLASQGKKATIIHANNVMAHVPDINGFVEGIKLLLENNGTAIIEVPYLLDLIQKLAFDTVYHEHVYYLAVTPLVALFRKHGLHIVDIEKLELHGGSLRLFVKHLDSAPPSANVQGYIDNEANLGLCKKHFFDDIMSKIIDLKDNLLDLLQDAKARGKTVAAYGASAKGTTLLNYFDIDEGLIDFMVDISPTKQGLYTPGKHIEILNPDRLDAKKPDYTLLLTWNFAEEILAQQGKYRKAGGKFILPIPEVKVV